MPREVFVAGQILTAAEMNVVSDATVMTFAGTAARGSAIPSPVEGMVTYLEDVNGLTVYDGSAWIPAASGASLGSGTILQVVQTFMDAPYTISLGSLAVATTDVTGLTATITPRATSSKILVTVQTILGRERGRTGYVLRRDSTNIAVGDSSNTQRVSSGINLAATDAYAGPAGNMFLDSPNTASAITYAIRLFHLEATTRTCSVNTLTNTAGGASTITLMEIAG